MEDQIVLVDEQNNVLGLAPKLESHNANTPLHRAFSIFIFNDNGQVLLSQRSSKKKTWPLVWSNSCCGHQKLHEPLEQTVRERIKFELGINLTKLYPVLPNYRYRFKRNGVVENEICPVFVGFTNNEPQLNPDEVNATKWISWNEWLKEIKLNSKTYTEWGIEETELLDKNKIFYSLLKNTTYLNKRVDKWSNSCSLSENKKDSKNKKKENKRN